MNKENLVNYIESSFLKPLLMKEEITDITYNGKKLFFVTNKNGREIYQKDVDKEVVKDFLRQLANISEKQFSYLSPILDINIDRYRINAVHNSIVRNSADDSFSFAIRIASKSRRINKDHAFMPKRLEALFEYLVSYRNSLVICGETGVGKTELQKYLISRMKDNERIIIIDNTIELMYVDESNKYDLTLWQADDRNSGSSLSSLIRNGLRNNPDWMIISEARGKEMDEILNSVMTGVPIITTIHSLDAFSAPNRIARMVMQNEKHMEYKDVLDNVNYHFRFYIYLKKVVLANKEIKRYISSVVHINKDGKPLEIYKASLNKSYFPKISKIYLENNDFITTDRNLKEFLNE